ncbi:MAG: hypothetical protein MK207_09915 [Saprospiraceae bacterium]|nr:hypothetical protein [Saprospiraceae bacterium]
MTKYLFSILCALLLTISVGYTQDKIDSIPNSPDACYKYMEAVMLVQKRKDCEDIMNIWKENQNANKWTTEHYNGLVELGNEMINHKMKRYNFFKHLIATINIFSDDIGLSSKHFNNWISISKQLLQSLPQGKLDEFELYLKFFHEFWNTGHLYDISKGSHKWKADSKDFEIKYSEGSLSIIYENTNLLCFHKKDSLEIFDVKGIYYPLEYKWKGYKGQVNWTAKGATNAYASLNTFTIHTKSTFYTCNQATLHYNSIFSKPINGILKDIATVRSVKKLGYPIFISNSRKLAMDDIGEGVSFIGGFRMTGATIKGYGDDKGLSTVYVKNNKDQTILKAESTNFDIIKGEKVLSSEAKVSLYIHNENGSLDSIFHPNIQFIYDIVNRKVNLTRGNTNTSRVPFTNSLQEMDLTVIALSWLIDSDELVLGDNNNELEMASKNYFDHMLLEKYQNIISINPLIKFAVYSTKLSESEELLDSRSSENENWDDSPTTDSDYCEFYPEFCDEFGVPLVDTDPEEDVPIDTAFLMEIGEWPPSDEVDEIIPETVELIETGPRVIHARELAALLDKRMEKITILTSIEIEKASKNPNFKVIHNDQSYREFEKGFPKIFKFGIMDVYNLFSVVPNPSFDAKSSLPLFLELVKDGFVLYNKENKTVTLRDKLFHYAASVNTKKRDHDFDKIKIKSVPSYHNKESANGILNMKEGTIKTFGVQEFILSDSQNVIARPFNGNVIMKKDRNMDFNGILSGGFCNFTGSNFHFIYDIFHVEMDSINFIDMFIFKRARHGPDAGLLAGRPKPERAINANNFLSNEKEHINSVIEGGSGLLLIDVPSNKSGRMISDPIYPSFELTSNARVYYDRQNRLGKNVYPRDSFYYEMEPFMLDGLDDLVPEQLVFNGKLYASDIFEPITEELKVMYHDLSLGFETETRGNDPNPIYIKEDKKGKGQFKGVIGLSNEGLLGSGKIDYLDVSIESEYIEFMPKQLRVESVDSFNLNAGIYNEVEFPKVKGEKVTIDWIPYKDSMYIESIIDSIPFELFDSTNFNLNGSLFLTPKGLLGEGIIDWNGATLSSNEGGNFQFGTHTINSKSTALKIKSSGDIEFAFENDNVEAKIDLLNQIGDFIAKEEDIATDLPYNSYETTLNQFHWDMSTNHIFMNAEDGKTGFFLAAENQDSLVFLGERADFDLNTGMLKIDGVEFIRIADAFIYPKDKHIEIDQGSHMQTLFESTIIADTINQIHTIHEATINVLNRNNYTAEGLLEFNIDGFKDQQILLDNISIQKSENQSITIGNGSVSDSSNFFLDKRTKFKGNVNLIANFEMLTFQGYAKMSSSVIPTTEWFEIDSKINKNDVLIEFNKPKNPQGEEMHVGLFLDLDTMLLYPAILTPKTNPTDRSIFSTIGLVKYDSKSEMHYFGDSARVSGNAEVGNLFTVSEKDGKVTASGHFDFNTGFNSENSPPVLVDVVGDFSFFLNKDSEYLFETSMNLDFYIPQVLRDIIVSDLHSNPELEEKILYASVKNEKLHQHMKSFITDEHKFEKMWKKVTDDEHMHLPHGFKHTFFFINNELMWSPKTQSFITQGHSMQLANIAGKHIGQVVRGHLEILNDPTRGDALTFFIVSPNGDWYFFSYQSGFLKTVSSNPDYNNAISSLKPKDRKIKSSNGTHFEVIISSPSEYSSFKNKASSAHDLD